MDQLVQRGSRSEGNTSPQTSMSEMTLKRVSPSKSWCFTHNNWNVDQLDQLVQTFVKCDMSYIIGREIGECGTPHLQGFVHSKKVKFRPIEKFKLDFSPHWEKCKGTFDQNVTYCSKEGDFLTNIDMEEPLDCEEPYGWQLQVMDIIKDKPDKRTIHWFWEPNGNVGKSELVRYLVIKHDAIVCAGKAADMKYQITQMKKKPKLVIFDIPRVNLDYISYTGIEEIKNGVFASQKYESGMCVMNRPHVVIFANSEPRIHAMSSDRWHIVEISVEGGEPPQPPEQGE